MTEEPISRQQVKDALARVLASDEFGSNSDRSRFLKFIVTETLEGRAEQIKGSVVAVEVYGREADFDQQSDPIVRVEARKLRRDLEHYYLTTGSRDEVRINVPKGGYVPTFDLVAHNGNEDGPSGAYSDVSGSEAVNELPRTSFLTSRTLALYGVIFAVIIVSASLFFWRNTQDIVSDSRSIVGPTLFVFPFEGSTGDPSELSLAKGVTIELINKLSTFNELQLYPAGSAVPISEVLAGSNSYDNEVAYALSGIVQLVGNKIQITARLQHAVQGRHIWSQRYDGDFSPSRIFEIQERIASNVAKKLAEPFGLLGKISSRSIASGHNPTLEAYKCVLLGYQYRATFLPELHGKARTCLERAVKTDPDYSRAWALLAHIYVDEYRFFYNSRPNAYRRSIDAGRKAVELNPSDALSYQALSIALFGNGEIESALKAARKAVETNPQNNEALMQLGYRTYATGRWKEAYSLVEEAANKTVSPPAWYPWVPALYHYKNGDYQKALADAEAAGLNHMVLMEATRAAIYGQLDMAEKATASLAHIRQLDPQFDTRARRWFAVHQFPEDFLDLIMDGLHKAGLPGPSSG